MYAVSSIGSSIGRRAPRLSATAATATTVASLLAWLSLAACHAPLRGESAPRDATYEACVGGDLDACLRSGSSQAARGDDEGRRRALVAFQFACLQEHGDACAELAALGEVGAAAVGRAGAQRATEAMREACDEGRAGACMSLAESTADAQRKASLLRRACEAGHGEGCAELAGLRRASWRLESSLTEALRLDERACELGAPAGCLQAGRAHLFGSGVPADRDTAMALLDQACNAEVAYGCDALVQIFDEGIGVARDPITAARYAAHSAAAERGLGAAASADASAFVLYAAACSQGDPLGCFNAGWYRAEGREVARNIEVSRELFTRACKGGVVAACGRWESIDAAEVRR